MAKFVALLKFTDNEALRLETRPSHREYLRSLFDAGKLAMSGPWADDTGAMLIYEADSLADAEALLNADPYRAAGVLADARIREWRVVLPAE
ncbi:MAG: YciI family protein [Thermomicrobiales bacterium]